MASASLAGHLKCIGLQPEILECPSPIHLGAFFYGYALVVPEFAWLSGALDAQFSGPAQARAWTRAYLAFGNEAGLTRAVEAAVSLLEEPGRKVLAHADAVPDMFVDVVVEAIRSNRPGTVLGESTIPWLYNFGLGAQAATDDHFPEIALQRRAQLLRFEAWLQRYFDTPGVPWQRILRAFEGPSERAVHRFASLWAEHLK